MYILKPLLLSALMLALMSCGAAPVQGELASGSRYWEGLIPDAKLHVIPRLEAIENMTPIDQGVLFLGDSLTEGAPLYDMFPDLKTANYGIGWDTTDGVLLRLNQVTRNSPERLFMMIGTNDTNYTDDAEAISANIIEIVSRLKAQMTTTDFYVISTLPRNQSANEVLLKVNEALERSATDTGFVYLDLASHMRAPNGEMLKRLSHDNLHLNVEGYALWAEVLSACVWDGCPQGLSSAN